MAKNILLVVLAAICGCAGCQQLQPDQVPDYIRTVVLNRPFGNARLIVGGGEPRLLSETCIMGNVIAEIQQSEDVLWYVSSDETDQPIRIDFTDARKGWLRVTYHTTDPRQPYEENVPFVLETVHLEHGKAVSEWKILLEKEKFDPAHAEALAEAFRKAIQEYEPEDGPNYVMEQSLGSLRNMGLDSPDMVLPILNELARSTADRHSDISAGISEYSWEIAWVKRIKEHRSCPRVGGNSS